MDQFIQLQKKRPIETPYRHTTDFVTPCTIEKIIKLMRCAFHQAVRWDIIGKNPSEDAILPKREKKAVSSDCRYYSRCLNHCSDGKLYVAINLAFACSNADGRNHRPYMGTVFIYQMKKSLGMMLVWIEKERLC